MEASRRYYFFWLRCSRCWRAREQDDLLTAQKLIELSWQPRLVPSCCTSSGCRVSQEGWGWSPQLQTANFKTADLQLCSKACVPALGQVGLCICLCCSSLCQKGACGFDNTNRFFCFAHRLRRLLPTKGKKIKHNGQDFYVG